MNETLYAAVTGAVIGAAGGLVVWLLSWAWLRYTELRMRKRIRIMVSIELDENLAALRAFLFAAQNQVTLPNSPLAQMQRRGQFATSPLPAWKHTIWAGLLASIPLALKEQEIREVHQFHFDLDELTRLRQASDGVSSGYGGGNNLEAQINTFLKKGNPLIQ
jgi:hypothetical protein